MRLFLIILFACTFFAVDAFAQSNDVSGRTYYNSRVQTNSDTPLYNASGSSYYSKGPISIKQMLEGKGSDAADGTRTFNSASPYGGDRNNYSLSLSPAEVRASRARRAAESQRAERENQRRSQQTAQAGYAQDEADNYLGRFQTTGNPSTTAVSGKRRVFRKKKTLDLEIPKKVFNSIY